MMKHRNYKKWVVPTIFSFLFIISITIVFAVTDTDDYLSKYHSAKDESDKIENLGIYNSLVIQKRLNTINSFSSQLSSDYRILDTDKMIINTLLDETKNKLTENQNNISSSSLEDLKLMVNEIYTNTRVYQVVMPKAYGWRTVARSDFILNENVTVYIDDLKSAIAYQKSRGVNTKNLEESVAYVEELSEELGYRVRLVKDSLDEMQAGSNLSEERSLLEGAKSEMLLIKELLEDVQFEMRLIVKMLEPYY